MEYGVGFGNKATKAGDIFRFKDFDLVFNGQRALSLEQKNKKEKSIAEGIDGGDSMLQPSSSFSIFQGSKKVTEFELMILPYRKYLFDLDGKKFELRNSLKEGLWILSILK